MALDAKLTELAEASARFWKPCSLREHPLVGVQGPSWAEGRAGHYRCWKLVWRDAGTGRCSRRVMHQNGGKNLRAGTYGLAGALGRYAQMGLRMAVGRYAPTSQRSSRAVCNQRRQSGGMPRQDGTAVGRYAPPGCGGLSSAMHRQAGGGSRALCTAGQGGAVGRYATTGLLGQSGGMHRRAVGGCLAVCTDGRRGQSGGMHRRAGCVGRTDVGGGSRAVCIDGPGGAVSRYVPTSAGAVGRYAPTAGRGSPSRAVCTDGPEGAVGRYVWRPSSRNDGCHGTTPLTGSRAAVYDTVTGIMGQIRMEWYRIIKWISVKQFD